MGTTTPTKNVAGALFGQVRRTILALLFTHSDQAFYTRQIARTTGGGLGAVHRELGNLVEAGLVVRTRQGRQVYYQADRSSHVFADVRGLVVRTMGIADVLRNALAPLADRIVAAFVYGSVARGSEKSESDIDVLIVGDVDFGEVVSILGPMQDQLHREVNPSVFSKEELRKRAADKEHFVTSVLRGPKIMLIGEDDELRAMV